MTTQPNAQLERAHESYRELEQAHKAVQKRLFESELTVKTYRETFRSLEEEITDKDALIDSMRNDHAETEERYQNEIKRLNKIIDSIQGWVGTLEGRTK